MKLVRKNDNLDTCCKWKMLKTALHSLEEHKGQETDCWRQKTKQQALSIKTTQGLQHIFILGFCLSNILNRSEECRKVFIQKTNFGHFGYITLHY